MEWRWWKRWRGWVVGVGREGERKCKGGVGRRGGGTKG